MEELAVTGFGGVRVNWAWNMLNRIKSVVPATLTDLGPRQRKRSIWTPISDVSSTIHLSHFLSLAVSGSALVFVGIEVGTI